MAARLLPLLSLLLVILGNAQIGHGVALPVVNPRLTTDSSLDTSSVTMVVRQIIRPGMSAEEKALACWRFMLDHFYHWHPPQEESVPGEVRDFAKAVNSYGYGPCFVNTPVLAALWQSAGLESRAWRLGGHTVPEVRYGGRWHMLDADARAWHRGSDGQIASVADLASNPSLFLHPRERSVPYYPFAPPDLVAAPLVPWSRPSSMMELYLSQDNNQLANRKAVIGHPMDLTLRAGERLTLAATNTGRWNRTGRWYLPENIRQEDGRALETGPVDTSGMIRYGNGELHWQPELSQGATLADLWLGTENIRPGARGLERVRASREGVAVFRVWSPYVMVGARMRASVGTVSPTPPGCEISTDGGHAWQRLADATWDSNSLAGALSQEWDLSGQVAGKYEYLLRVHLQTTPLKGIDFATTVQLAPLALPTLKPGPNTVTIAQGSDQGHVQLVLGEQEVGNARYLVESKGEIGKGQVTPQQLGEECYLVYRLRAPAALTAISVGGQLLLDQAADQFIATSYSLDAGKTWQQLWRLANRKNRDDPEFEIDKRVAVKNPAGSREVLVKFALTRNSPVCAVSGVRLYGFYRQPQVGQGRLKVEVVWQERHGREWQEKRWSRVVARLPHRAQLRCEGEEVRWARVVMTPVDPQAPHSWVAAEAPQR